MKKTIQKIGEEIWDKHSEYVDDSLYAMDSVTGSSIIPSRYRFLRALNEATDEYKDQHVKPLVEALEAKDKELESEGKGVDDPFRLGFILAIAVVNQTLKTENQ